MEVEARARSTLPREPVGLVAVVAGQTASARGLQALRGRLRGRCLRRQLGMPVERQTPRGMVVVVVVVAPVRLVPRRREQMAALAETVRRGCQMARHTRGVVVAGLVLAVVVAGRELVAVAWEPS